MSFSDAFVEASNTPLESHAPTTGTGWSLTGTTNVFEVHSASDTLHLNVLTADAVVLSDDLGGVDQAVEARLKALKAFPNTCVALRVTDKDNFIGWACIGTGSGGFRLYNVVAGTWNVLHSRQGVDESVYRIEAVGTTITLKVDGATVFSTTVTDNTTATRQGVVRINSGTPSTDLWIDDYLAESLSTQVDTYGTLAFPALSATGNTAGINASAFGLFGYGEGVGGYDSASYLDATVAVELIAAAELKTSITLVAALQAGLAAASGLSTAITMNAAVSADSTAAAELATAITLAPQPVVADLTALAELTTGITMSAQAAAGMASSVDLTTQITMTAAVSAEMVAYPVYLVLRALTFITSIIPVTIEDPEIVPVTLRDVDTIAVIVPPELNVPVVLF